MTLKFYLRKHARADDGSDQIFVETVLSVPELVEFSKLLGFDEDGGRANAGNVTRGGIEDHGSDQFVGCKITPDGPVPETGVTLPPIRLEATITEPRVGVVSDETD